MSAVELRQRIRRDLQSLPPSRLRVVAEFVDFLRDRGDDSATAELLAIPGCLKSITKGLAEARSGRVTPVGRLRRRS